MHRRIWSNAMSALGQNSSLRARRIGRPLHPSERTLASVIDPTDLRQRVGRVSRTRRVDGSGGGLHRSRVYPRSAIKIAQVGYSRPGWLTRPTRCHRKSRRGLCPKRDRDQVAVLFSFIKRTTCDSCEDLVIWLFNDTDGKIVSETLKRAVVKCEQEMPTHVVVRRRRKRISICGDDFLDPTRVLHFIYAIRAIGVLRNFPARFIVRMPESCEHTPLKFDNGRSGRFSVRAAMWAQLPGGTHAIKRENRHAFGLDNNSPRHTSLGCNPKIELHNLVDHHLPFREQTGCVQPPTLARRRQLTARPPRARNIAWGTALVKSETHAGTSVVDLKFLPSLPRARRSAVSKSGPGFASDRAPTLMIGA